MKNDIPINVNHSVLIWARKSLALNRNNAAERAGISSKRLLQLETGEKLPTLEELKTLSKAYKRTIATLLLKKPPHEKPLPKDRRTVDSKELGSFHEKTIMAIRKARALAQSYVELSQEMELDIPSFNLSASMLDKPDVVARKIRKLLRLHEIREITNINHALEAYIDRVESLGVAVFQLSLTQDGIRGFSITDDVLPVIGIKGGSEQTQSKTFTLFHELGHILLNEGAICDLSESTSTKIEKWCNAFSAEVLVPADELLQMEVVIAYERQGQKSWVKKDLIGLANYFHVGPLAILRSLLEANLTTPEFYKEKHRIWNKPPFGRAKEPEGRNIPKEMIREKGRNYIGLAFKAFDQNRINLKDLADFLGVKLSYIPKTRELLNAG